MIAIAFLALVLLWLSLAAALPPLPSPGRD